MKIKQNLTILSSFRKKKKTFPMLSLHMELWKFSLDEGDYSGVILMPVHYIVDFFIYFDLEINILLQITYQGELVFFFLGGYIYALFYSFCPCCLFQ